MVKALASNVRRRHAAARRTQFKNENEGQGELSSNYVVQCKPLMFLAMLSPFSMVWLRSLPIRQASVMEMKGKGGTKVSFRCAVRCLSLTCPHSQAWSILPRTQGAFRRNGMEVKRPGMMVDLVCAIRYILLTNNRRHNDRHHRLPWVLTVSASPIPVTHLMEVPTSPYGSTPKSTMVYLLSSEPITEEALVTDVAIEPESASPLSP